MCDIIVRWVGWRTKLKVRRLTNSNLLHVVNDDNCIFDLHRTLSTSQLCSEGWYLRAWTGSLHFQSCHAKTLLFNHKTPLKSVNQQKCFSPGSFVQIRWKKYFFDEYFYASWSFSLFFFLFSLFPFPRGMRLFSCYSSRDTLHKAINWIPVDEATGRGEP